MSESYSLVEVIVHAALALWYTKHKILTYALFFQLEEKTRRLRELESASNLWEGRIRQLEKEKLELETKVTQTRQALDEHVARLSKQVIITWFASLFSHWPQFCYPILPGEVYAKLVKSN